MLFLILLLRLLYADGCPKKSEIFADQKAQQYFHHTSLWMQYRFASTPHHRTPVFPVISSLTASDDVHYTKATCDADDGFPGTDLDSDAFIASVEYGALSRAQLTERCVEPSCGRDWLVGRCWQRASSPYTRVALVSVLHAPGEPYQVPCLVCSPFAVQSGRVKVFYRLRQRDPFVNFFRIPEDEAQFQSKWKMAGYTLKSWYMGTVKEMKEGVNDARMPCNEDEPSGRERLLYAAGRAPTDGRLLVDADPAGYGEYLHDLNAATYMCAERVDGDRVRHPEVAVNADTLVRLDDALDSEDATACYMHDTPPSRDPPTVYWRLSDAQSAADAPTDDRTTLAAHNLMLATHWQPWSCCSGCCCKDADECGAKKLVPTKQQCDSMVLTRRRRGLCVFKKADTSKPIVLNGVELAERQRNCSGEAVELCDAVCQWQLLDKWLSTSPYREEGIGCFSTLIMTTNMYGVATWLHDAFQRQLSKMKIGLFLDSKTCSDEEKRDCEAWRRCRDDKPINPIDEGGGDTVTSAPSTGTTASPPADSCAQLDFVELRLTARKHSKHTVDLGKNYRVVLVDSGAYAYVRWQRRGQDVPLLDASLACDAQRQPVFVAANGKDLLLLRVRAEDTRLALVATGHFADNTTDATRKLTLQVRGAAEAAAKTNRIILFLAIILAGAIAFIIVVALLYYCSGRKSETKSDDKAKSEASRQ